MTEPALDLEDGWSRMAERWESARVERTLVGLHSKLRRRRLRWRAAVSCSATLLGLVLAVQVWRGQQPLAALPGASLAVPLGDGSGADAKPLAGALAASASDDDVQVQLEAARPALPTCPPFAYSKRATSRRNAHAVADDVEQLLLAAESARASGHSQAALPYLRQVIACQPADARAGHAAFTLGVLLLQRPGRSRARAEEAEVAFARARELLTDPVLAEDAWARQVEAARRAGAKEQARALARDYEARYPHGRHLAVVRRYDRVRAR